MESLDQKKLGACSYADYLVLLSYCDWETVRNLFGFNVWLILIAGFDFIANMSSLTIICVEKETKTENVISFL